MIAVLGPMSSMAKDLRLFPWLAANLDILEFGDFRVVINPETGSWLVCDEPSELQRLFSDPRRTKVLEGCPQRTIKPLNPLSESEENTDHLYFFEFVVTLACNLACSYCFAGAGPGLSASSVDFEMAERFVDRIAEYRAESRSAERFVIEFTGGEPLLRLDIIKHTIEYAQRSYGELLNAEYCMQTNGTQLNDRTLKNLKSLGVRVGISCDGYGQTHDSQRPYVSGRPSHSAVEQAMRKLQVLAPEIAGGVITVVTPDTVTAMPEMALYLALCGYHDLVFRPVEKLGRGAANDRGDGFQRAYVDGLFSMLTDVITPLFHSTGHLLREHYLALTFEHLLTATRPFMCERAPCGGARNICATTPDGSVYVCHQASGKSEFRIGSLTSDTFTTMLQSPVATQLSSRTPDAIARCSECAFRSWCQSPCPITARAMNDEIMSPSGECEMLQYRYKRALQGLIDREFDLEVVAKLAGLDGTLQWNDYYTMDTSESPGRCNS